MVINVKEIAKLGWSKRWAGPFSILSASYWGRQLIVNCRDNLGKGFKHSLYTYKNRVITAFDIKSERQELGDFLVQKIIKDNELINIWSQGLKRETDAVKSILNEPTENFLQLEKYKDFEKPFEDYLPFHVAVKTLPDHLPPNLLEKYLPILEDARMHSESMYQETAKFFTNLTKLIGEKENVEPKLILCLLQRELIDYLKSGNLPSKELLEKRFNLSAMLFMEGEFYELYGEDVLQLEEGIVHQSGLTAGKVSGTTAFPGKVNGTCRIILDPFNFKEFNKGDILVTGMTRPDFVPLMEKAAAIVTDAGGMLCHAAIISREMKKPCIVGTETATKSFKDGDLLEVNATEGVVKKID